MGVLGGCRSNAVEKSVDAPDAPTERSASPGPAQSAPPKTPAPADSNADDKLESALLREIERRESGEPLAPTLRPLNVPPDGRVLVDIEAKVGPELEERIRALGGTVVSSVPRFDAVQAHVPLDSLRKLAAEPNVRRIRRATAPMTNSAADAAPPPRSP